MPGDVVLLESGNRVPADLRLLTAQGLEIDESLLTGESVPVSKDARWTGDPHTPLADQGNMAFGDATAIRGRGRGVVVATGSQTAVGQLALGVIGATAGKPPLIERMERFTHVIGMAVLCAVAIVGLLGVFVRGYSIGEMFLFAVAMAVSAIPEGLPVALTVALAVRTPAADAPASDALFYALPADADAPPPATVALHAFDHTDGRCLYRVAGTDVPPGFKRADRPLCRVWRDPLQNPVPTTQPAEQDDSPE